MKLDGLLRGIERVLAAIKLPAGPDNLINHRVILAVFAGLTGALIGWVVTEPFGTEDFTFWREFLMLCAVGFFIAFLVISVDSFFEKNLKLALINVGMALIYSTVIIVPTVAAVKLILTPPVGPPPVSLKTFVLDTSHSMTGYPLETLKAAVKAYVDLVDARGARERTRMACVEFSDYAGVVSAPTSDYPAFVSAVDGLSADGVTNMARGLEEARLITETFLKASANSRQRNLKDMTGTGSDALVEVILVTDGVPFAPNKNIEECKEAVRAEVPHFSKSRIPIHTVGAGKQYDRDLLQSIADGTGGSFTAADDISSLVHVMERIAQKGITTVKADPEEGLSSLLRIIAWVIIGCAIGLCSCLLQGSSGSNKLWGLVPLPSPSKRSLFLGLVGGCVGGLLGSVMFELIRYLFLRLDVTSGVANRFVGFAILGACIGFFLSFLQSAAKRAWIRITRGAGEGRLFVIDRSAMILGRSEMVDIPVFGDLSIEEENLRLDNSESGLLVQTIGPMNLKVNGVLVRKKLIPHRGMFTVGETDFIYLAKRQ